MKLLLAIALALTATAVHAQAQDFPKVEVFGGYSILRLNVPDNIGGQGEASEVASEIAEFALGNMLGWSAAATVNMHRHFGITADFNGHHKSLDLSFEGDRVEGKLAIHSFLFGPTFKTANERVNPFFRVLFGVARIDVEGSFNGDSESFDTTDFAASLGGGVDVNATPNIAVRAIEFEYFPFKAGEGSQVDFAPVTFQNFRFRSGVVFRF